MIQHPTIAAALAEQRRAAFMTEAETARLAREARVARNGGGRSARWPARWLYFPYSAGEHACCA